MKNRPVIIHWLDSFGISTDWESPASVKYKPGKMLSAGWIIKKTKRYIRLAPHRSKGKHSQVCGVMAIPRCAITKIEQVK